MLPRTAAILFSGRAVAALYGIRFRRRSAAAAAFWLAAHTARDSGVQSHRIGDADLPSTAATWRSFALRAGDWGLRMANGG